MDEHDDFFDEPMDLLTVVIERDRYREALKAIDLHHAMPDGESWEQAYSEVCAIACEALDATTGREKR